MLDLIALRYFVSAFETGTFSRAARANDVSQPTVSAAIQKLEDRLQGPLFHRSRSGLNPTPLAKRLYQETVDSVAHLSTLEARMRDRPEQILRLYCAPDMLMARIAPGLRALRLSQPGLVIRLADSAGTADLTYGTETCAPEGHDYIHLTEEPFALALSRHDPLAQYPALTLDDLRDQTMIHRPYCPHADRMGLTPTQSPAAEARHDAELLDLVAAGLGIAFVPVSHGEGRGDIVVRPLSGVDTGHRRAGLSHRRSAVARDYATRLASLLTGPHAAVCPPVQSPMI